ncbi:WbqC family protein [Limisalsivibrio acetivorans]|uniref:WbqC family protein n=1 Tax=Limisalsivibrio acetivorans TaxID=1304888 RepID=UPI0003B7B884|nr:WbqC family protein [Limisalsivibrio acetivorans]
MSAEVCAVHQPNFFPWLGYFEKISRADRFVIFDDAQFPRTSRGCWSNRVYLRLNNDKNWLTAPVERDGVKDINETYFKDTSWRESLRGKISSAYAKASYYKEHRDFVFALLDYPENNLALYNTYVIKEICTFLGIDTSGILISSKLDVSGESNEKLARLTLASGCSVYMSGDGAEEYLDSDIYEKLGVELIRQNFVHPVYEQRGEGFLKGLSIIDWIFNMGAKNPFGNDDEV